MFFLEELFTVFWNQLAEWFEAIFVPEEEAMAPPPFRIISIEGNIGSGKSTLLKTLQESHTDFLEENNIVVVLEPVEKWEAYKDPVDGESILAKFYKHPQRYAFMLQIYILETMIEAIENTIIENPDMRVLLCERSIMASMNIFAQLLLESDYMTPIEHRYFERLVTEYSHYFPDDIIYLDVPVDVCMRRIEKRNRKGESGVTMDYLEKWEKQCVNWLNSVGCGGSEDDAIDTVVHLPYNETEPDFPIRVLKDVLQAYV
jgi:deoxyguanosine kinase